MPAIIVFSIVNGVNVAIGMSIFNVFGLAVGFKSLHGIDISDDGHRLYVSGKIDGKLHVLDAESGDVLQSIYLGPEISSQPSGVACYSN